jgi:hypothetical protein
MLLAQSRSKGKVAVALMMALRDLKAFVLSAVWRYICSWQSPRLCVCVLQGPPGTGTGPGATDSVSSLKGLDLDEASLSELDDEVSSWLGSNRLPGCHLVPYKFVVREMQAAAAADDL